MITTNLVTLRCYLCNVEFGLHEEHYQNRRKDGRDFFCPNGHSQAFVEAAEVVLKRTISKMQAKLDQEEARVRDLAAQVERKQRKLDRVEKGVCPKCNRFFPNLSAHMKCKHGKGKK